MQYKFLTLILTVLLASFAFHDYKQTQKLAELESKFNDMSIQKDGLIDDLTIERDNSKANEKRLAREIDNLRSNYTDLEQSHEELSISYESLTSEIDKTIEKIDDYQDELNNSMAWFQANSAIVDIPNEHRIKGTIDGSCYDESCVIKLGCFFLINSERLNFKYKTDPKMYGEADKLQSLYEFVHNWGGDCEDYSLFYKAEFNHVLENCAEPRIEAWIPGNSQYFLDIQEEWLINDAQGYLLPEGYIYPNVVCGEISNNRKAAGHCVIAFSNEILSSVEDMKYLKDAPMIEPQTGMYIGTIGDRYKLSKNSIWLIITDSDLIMYSSNYGEWISFETAIDELEEVGNRLLELIS